MYSLLLILIFNDGSFLEVSMNDLEFGFLFWFTVLYVMWEFYVVLREGLELIFR